MTAFRCFLVVFAAAALAAVAAAQPPDYDRTRLGDVQDRARDLAYEVERLQEDIVYELQGPRREEKFFRLADAVLADLGAFRRGLKEGVNRRRVYEDFATMDAKLHELIDGIRALGDAKPGLQRSVSRVERADSALHYAMSVGDPDETRGRDVVKRQAHAFVDEARGLAEAAHHALPEDRRGKQIEDELIRLAQAGDRFDKIVQAGVSREQAVNEFAGLDLVYQRVIQVFGALTPKEGAYLRYRIERLESVYQALHQTLQVKGDRPRFSFRD